MSEEPRCRKKWQWGIKDLHLCCKSCRKEGNSYGVEKEFYQLFA